MINTKTIEFRANLGRLINESKLPPINVHLVLQDMLNQIDNQLTAVLMAEKGANDVQQNKLEG